MHIGPWRIELYTLRILIGAVCGLVSLWWRAPAWGLSRRAAGGWLWGIALAALVGGRVGYILGHRSYFGQDPQAVWRLWDIGGLHGGTALTGSLVVVWLWARVTRRPFSEMLSWLAPAILLIAAGAWWGCSIGSCAWGRATAMPLGQRSWFVTPSSDIYRNILPRYAVQNLGALCAFLLTIVALLTRSRAAAALALYELASGALTFLRADEVPLIAGIRVDSLQDIGIAWAIFWSMRPHRAAGSASAATYPE